ncbi:hypothetical protein DPMN_140257 [Dreissena polymorpha]|uniref:Uncharacterized protein n=1 Tax=Dreissena polymorpha TaxID=45954 RepID=A0A9D4GAI5_DREPO|nr:hypothetical protein DPMN_140257 [Dreissena polymorpha]
MAHYLSESVLLKIESEKGKKRTVKAKTPDVEKEMRQIRDQRTRLVEERQKKKTQTTDELTIEEIEKEKKEVLEEIRRLQDSLSCDAKSLRPEHESSRIDMHAEPANAIDENLELLEKKYE